VRFIREREFAGMLDADLSTRSRWAKAPDCPDLYKLDPNTIAWEEAEVIACVMSRREQSVSVARHRKRRRSDGNRRRIHHHGSGGRDPTRR
jgi:predicted DNA-binding transcriptional regulator AlpA